MKTKRMNWSWRRNERGDHFVKGVSVNGRQEFGSTEGYRRKERAIANAVMYGGAPPALRQMKEGEVLRYTHRVVQGRLVC